MSAPSATTTLGLSEIRTLELEESGQAVAAVSRTSGGRPATPPAPVRGQERTEQRPAKSEREVAEKVDECKVSRAESGLEP